MAKFNGPLRVGIGGPVGSGKTALMDLLCKTMRAHYDIAAITNDIYTKWDAEFLVRSGSLTPDRIAIKADGEDVAVFTVAVTDAQGRVVPVAGDKVNFELTGPGRIIGVGNGDPSCHEPDTYFAEPAIRTIPVAGWRWQKVADIYADKLPEIASDFADHGWTPADVDVSKGIVSLRQQAVFRARFTATPEMLAAGGLELWFGRIEGDARVYLNGEKLGPGSDSGTPCVYNPKGKLRPGENVVAVSVASWSDTAGLSKGVKMRLIDEAPPVAWSRSVFNGLAQIIVQSSRQAGTLKLTARAEGLKAATLELDANAAALRPAVP